MVQAQKKRPSAASIVTRFAAKSSLKCCAKRSGRQSHSMGNG